MKLSLYNINGRYAFAVDSFESIKHHYLFPGTKSTYSYLWEAYDDAKKISERKISLEAISNRNKSSRS